MPSASLPSRLLVKSGAVFGISEGTTRVALSRMVNAGELEAQDGEYHLAGRLLERHQRQTASRAARHRAWQGEWEIVVVTAEGRDAGSRSALRDAMRRLQLAELREGVWVRPDNLEPDRLTEASAVVAEQCRRFVGRPDPSDNGLDDAALAAQLWDLEGWARRASERRAEMQAELPALEAGDTAALAPAFVLSAAVLRHLLADPELPDELLPPDWPGEQLRADYDHYDLTFKDRWRDWFRTQIP